MALKITALSHGKRNKMIASYPANGEPGARNRAPQIAVVAVGSPSGEQGGAERFYVGLCDALNAAGADASIHWELSDERTAESIKESYLRFYDCDLSHYDGVISTKAPGYMLRHRNHVCYLQHTMRIFYDMFDVERPDPSDEQIVQRRFFQTLDTSALQPNRVRKIFSIGHEVRDRLRHYNGIDSEILYQASTLNGLRARRYEYFLLPGRLHRWKRVDLAIQAMAFIDHPCELLISGAGEHEAWYRALASGDRRIRFLGRVADDELIRLYSDALAVLFTPSREDFGLITLEAFLSQKPVITCCDSGEPARLVRDHATGFVTKPNPAELAAAMRTLLENPAEAAAMGMQAFAEAKTFRWDKVARALMHALGFATNMPAPEE
jgi:glycosyltransferase involved in cell wall biosynthesis